jgi:hypothetical protein
MRRRYRYDKATDKFVEITDGQGHAEADSHATMVLGDIPAFVSPLDGTIVEGRKAYVEHVSTILYRSAGSEKVRPAGRAPEERKAMREFLWEKVDRVKRGYKAQD